MAAFEFVQPELVSKSWGYEVCICNTKLFSLNEIGYACKLLNLVPCILPEYADEVQTCSIHYHLKKTETFFVLNGVMFLEIFPLRTVRSMDGPLTMSDFEPSQGFIMYPGTAVTLNHCTAHRFWSQHTVATVIESSTPDDPKDSYRLVVSGRRLMDVSGFKEVRTFCFL